MLRNIIKTLPAFALALPVITAAPPASAGGKQAQGQGQGESQGQGQGQGQGQKPALPSPPEGQGQGQGQKPTPPSPEEGGGEVTIEIVQAMCVMAEVLAEHRACQVVDTDKGTVRCAARGGEQTKPETQKPKPKPEPEPEEGGVIYVGIEACTALGVDINVKK